MDGRLNNCILFRMQTSAQLVAFARRNTHLLTQAADIEAVIYSDRGPVVPGGNYSLVPDENSTHMTSQAGRTLGYKFCYAHKVFFPGWPSHLFHDFAMTCLFFVAERKHII
jgi:hypothetical protein